MKRKTRGGIFNFSKRKISERRFRYILIIDERINASRKPIAEAISLKNAAFLQGEAKAQDVMGADYIDVNAGTFVEEEAERPATWFELPDMS